MTDSQLSAVAEQTDSVTFADLGLPESLLSAIAKMGFVNPTPIQQQSIQPLMAGNDILGEAQTGSGKTAAFGLPGLARISLAKHQPQLMVLAPTRELAIQISDAIEQFGADMKGLRTATLCGGQPYGPQLKDLGRGPQVVVGTPGRLMDHIRKGRLDLSELKVCVLDEADEMLNMGFLEDIEWILEQIPAETQMALFSATMPPAIRKVTERFLKDPTRIQIESKGESRANITQLGWKVVRGMSKLTALERLAETIDYDAMLVFVRTRQDTITLAEHLEGLGHKVAALNGDMSQDQRERTVDNLRKGKISILIGTDVVARGLDVPRISHVLNYDLPSDTESYVHRIGRTGRAGRSGTAILFCYAKEAYRIRHLERATGGIIEHMEMPDAKTLGETRIEKCRQTLAGVAEKRDLAQMRELIGQMAEKSELSELDMAAALLHLYQADRSFFPKPDPEPRRDNRRDASERRNSRDGGERHQRNRNGERRNTREAVDFETYRIEVGKDHGARPGDIVGAIANEVQLESKFIGRVRLFERHSIVELPTGMPKPVFQHLKKVKVRNQPLAISQMDKRPRRERPPVMA